MLGLLRNPDQCVYGSASVSNAGSLGGGEDTFNRLSMEERGKVKEETLVNYGGRSRQGSYSPPAYALSFRVSCATAGGKRPCSGTS